MPERNHTNAPRLLAAVAAVAACALLVGEASGFRALCIPIFYLAAGASMYGVAQSLTRKRTPPRTSSAAHLHPPEMLIGAMTAGIVHNLRNYFSVLSGSLALLRRATFEGPNVQRALQMQEKCLFHADRMSTLLLKYAKGEWNHEKLMDDIEVAALLQDSVDLASMFLRDRGIAVEMRMEEKLPPIRGDETALLQSLLNVIKNAAEASPCDGKIEISAAASDDEPCVYITVRDFGKGLDTAMRRSIFHPFASTKKSGTGLGLFTVRTLLEDSGSSVSMNSEPGAGTEVVIKCPLAAAAETSAKDSAATPLTS